MATETEGTGQPSPDFITRHVQDMREAAYKLPPGVLKSLLCRGATIIEQLREGAATARAEHERVVAQLQARTDDGPYVDDVMSFVRCGKCNNRLARYEPCEECRAVAP